MFNVLNFIRLLCSAGTLITEPSEDTNIDGEMLCEEIFSTEQTYKDLAHKLVKIASYYRFDGWLLNIENKIRVPYIL